MERDTLDIAVGLEPGCDVLRLEASAALPYLHGQLNIRSLLVLPRVINC